ncbi:MAG: hypothetical protein CMO55_24600 [Verrucomicrobiales bacterium]|nr:hypothetical protein [Verrucomicrobiales bacterium]
MIGFDLLPKFFTEMEFFWALKSASLCSDVKSKPWTEIKPGFVPHSVVGETQLCRERLARPDSTLKISANNFGNRSR